MARGISLHIGLNNVDNASYPDLIIPTLRGCINDANDMKRIAQQAGFGESSTLIDSQATATEIFAKIKAASDLLVAGDIFFLTYSGHGGQIPDETSTEEDGMNETWILYDRQFLDDELFALWPGFKTGVRLLVLSDSCHSGTMVRFAFIDFSKKEKRISSRNAKSLKSNLAATFINTFQQRSLIPVQDIKRNISIQSSFSNYLANKSLYQNIQQLTKTIKETTEIKASLISISGCQDNQLSGDTSTNGVFTAEFLQVWADGSFEGNHKSFYDRILSGMPNDQTPQYVILGSNIHDFESQKPLTIADVVTPNLNISSTPSITGPITWNRNSIPPTFNIDKGGNPFYFLEITSDHNLFDAENNHSNRNSSNFYATWNDPNQSPRLTHAQFQLPNNAWNNLKTASRLYFRIGTTSSSDPTQWENYTVSTHDDQGINAPSMDITAVNNSNIPALEGNSEPAVEEQGSAKIINSVGLGGINNVIDVKLVQKLLNQVNDQDGGPIPDLIVDGLMGPNTINAIKRFQSSNELVANGLLEPDESAVTFLYIQSREFQLV